MIRVRTMVDENGKEQGGKSASMWPIYPALFCFGLALGLQGVSYFLLGYRGIDMLVFGVLASFVLLVIAAGFLISWTAVPVRQRVGVFALLFVVLAGYEGLRVPFYLMHYGILKRVEAEIDIAKLQAWIEGKKIDEHTDFDALQVQLPIPQPNDIGRGDRYYIRPDSLDYGTNSFDIEKNFGGGFWWFGVLIGPRQMQEQEDTPGGERRYHRWRAGVYTWL